LALFEFVLVAKGIAQRSERETKGNALVVCGEMFFSFLSGAALKNERARAWTRPE
jgi:hypothetical protein